ncbi:MAG: RnfABCDGE type electron transport complex subunit B [Oscillospiraceae bacterium]|nr:RnfABCDGE type electron transport complex subunit B [Oscillospiraceae bacterium]
MFNLEIMDIVWAIVVLGATGAVFGLVLALSSRAFAVETDERSEKLLSILPGANCGGCGFTGCALYAEAISKNGAPINKCAAGGQKTVNEIASCMGIEPVKSDRVVAVVKCSGGNNAIKKYEYLGLHDCLSASLLGGSGPNECSYGCLGLGTCLTACAFGAISIVDGKAKVDSEKCTGCMQCAEVCPKKIIVPVSYDQDVIIACSSHDRGAVLRKICSIGCLGCGICQKVCPSGAITLIDNLATIDESKCVDCGKCASKCPRGLISDAGLPSRQEIEAMEAAQAAAAANTAAPPSAPQA